MDGKFENPPRVVRRLCLQESSSTSGHSNSLNDTSLQHSNSTRTPTVIEGCQSDPPIEEPEQDIVGLLKPTDEELQKPYMQGYCEMVHDDQNELNVSFMELSRHVVSGCSITWDDDDLTIPNVSNVNDVGDVKPHVPEGVTTHVEATNETCAHGEGTVPYQPQRMTTEPLSTTETPLWVNELKMYLVQTVSSLESSLTEKFSSLESNLLRVDSRIDSLESNLLRVETKIYSIVAKVYDNQENNQEGASYFDGDDHGLYYMTPTRSIDGENNMVDVEHNAIEKQHSGIGVPKQSNMKVKSRPKRKRASSQYMVSSYTNPLLQPCYRRGENLKYGPLRQIPEEKKKGFLKYWKSEGNEAIMCGHDERRKDLFATIKKSHAWLDSEHMEEAMFGIRKRQQKYVDVFAQDVVVMDEVFGQLIQTNYCTHPEKLDELLFQYLYGNLPEKWVAVCVDLEAMKIVVYDCGIDGNSDEVVDKLMKSFCKMVPFLLKLSREFRHIDDRPNGLWPCTRSKDIPQDKSKSDCAIYTIKYIELDMANQAFNMISNDVMQCFREKLVADVFLG